VKEKGQKELILEVPSNSSYNNWEEATNAALRNNSSGTASNVVDPTFTVRHSDSPHTEQQRLLPTLAPSHSSMGLPPIQMRLDSEGLALKDSSSMALTSRVGSMPKGRSAFLSLPSARCISLWVASQRSHVFPSELTSLCQIIGNDFITSSFLL
jgi:hypothetical protein